MIFRNYLLRAFAADDLAALLVSMREVTLPMGHQIYRPGEKAEDVYFPSTAVLSVITAMTDGRSVETATIGFESAVGLLAVLSDEPVTSNVVAQIGGGAICVPAAALRRRASESPALMRLALRSALVNGSQAEQSVACMALHGVTQRLARWLLVTDDRIGGDVVPLTQDYLAIMVGVQRTTISAAAAELKSGGLVRYVRGRIEIIDRPGLEAQACECYQVNQAAFNRLGHLREEAFEAT